jgi:hypothetical protein
VSAGVQLRRYTLRPGVLDEFAELWRTQLVPLRRQFGFWVIGAWLLRDSNEFVWIVAHADDFQGAHDAYYGSAERLAMDPQPKRLIEQSASWMMEQFYPAEGERD